MAEAPRFKHGWIPLNGAAKEELAKRSANKLAERALGHAAQHPSGHQGYTAADVKALDSHILDSRHHLDSHHLDDHHHLDAHTAHEHVGTVSAHDAVVEHPGTAADLGPSSMGPSAFASSLESKMDGAKAGEHISVGQSKGRMRFVKAMTVAALAASALGFVGSLPGGDDSAPPDVGMYSLEEHHSASEQVGNPDSMFGEHGFTLGGGHSSSSGGGRKKVIVKLPGVDG
jgi:hypothetical protein